MRHKSILLGENNRLATVYVSRMVIAMPTVYLGIYFVLRGTHFIFCTGNAFHWEPVKWELDLRFVSDESIESWVGLFQPLIFVEKSIRLLEALVMHYLGQYLIFIGVAGMGCILLLPFACMVGAVLRRTPS